MSIPSASVATRLALSHGLLLLAPATLVVHELVSGPRPVVVAIACAALFGGGAYAWRVTRGVSRALRNATAQARRLADGSLADPVTGSGPGEFAALMDALRDMSDRLFGAVSKVRIGTTSVASMSALLTSDNNALSTRTESQASSLEETASTMEELTSTVRQNASNAMEANRLAASASQAADMGGQVVEDVVRTMGAIRESSRKVVDIISVIDGIAFQTNILALNAAVEAARAGEQGRGFAVVASEVRTLAQRSAAAAREIKDLIGESVDSVEAGSRQVDQAGAAMQEIITSVQRVTAIMNDISTASHEQSDGIEEINRAITQVDSTTQQNATLVHDATRATAHLHEQAMLLTQAVAGFDLGAREFGTAEDAVGMVHRAAAYYASRGRAAFIDDVNKLAHGTFIDRDLYVSVYSEQGQVVAHGSNPRLLGTDGYVTKDANGKLFVKEIMERAGRAGSGWVDYKWAHPLKKMTVVKSTYFEKVGDLVIACGFYKS